MEALVACVRDKTAAWSDRIRACQAVLDRAWGTDAKVEIDLGSEKVTSILIEIAHTHAEPAAALEPRELQQQPLIIDAAPASESID